MLSGGMTQKAVVDEHLQESASSGLIHKNFRFQVYSGSLCRKTWGYNRYNTSPAEAGEVELFRGKPISP